MIILIPAYEPDARLTGLIRQLRAADPGLRILVVDDGSGPDYQQPFKDAAGLGCTILRHTPNRGKGYALKQGFAHIAAHHPAEDVVCADSDGQHSVTDILAVSGAVLTRPTAMVLGTRSFRGNVPLRSRVGNAVTGWLFRLATGRTLGDTQTGLRGYPSAMLTWLQRVEGNRYEYELNLLLQAGRAGHGIETIPISTIYLDGNSSSHFRPLADSLRIYSPLLKYSLSSLAAFAVDAGALLVLNALTGSLLASVVGARVISSTLNFGINRRLVFRHAGTRPVAATARRYFVLVFALLVANFGILTLLVTAGLPLVAAKAVTEAVLFVAGYAVQHRHVFGTTPGPRRVTSPAGRRHSSGTGVPGIVERETNPRTTETP